MKVLNQASGENWNLINGDSCEVLKEFPSDSIHYSIFSPPFSSLFVYNNTPRDLGNCSDDETFFKHFKIIIDELYRVLMPGRLLSFHCMNLPTTKSMHGFIGIRDFRGALINAFCDAGFIYASEVCIWKNPVTAMQRTKALGLLHKQIKKDSTMSRQGLPDYLVTMRKPGVNPEPVTHDAESFPVDQWQRYASPVWASFADTPYQGFVDFQDPNESNKHNVGNGIDYGDTLQSMAEEGDCRHICPLQLPIILRALRLWTNPGDKILTPFAGIGSEVYTAVQEGRKGIGIELKKGYFDVAVKNLKRAENRLNEGSLI